MGVRFATESDAPVLMSLRAAWHGPESTDGFAEAFAAWFQRELLTRWWWLAVDDAGAPIGMVNLKVFDRMPSPARAASRWGYLSNLYVVPAHRGSGVGSDLIGALLDRASDEGLIRVVLSPSAESIPLYLRHGFRAADNLLVRHLDAADGGAS